MPQYGYAGSILDIDLTAQSVQYIPTPEEYRAEHLSGKALAARIMLDTLTGAETALSEENIVVITSSLLAGTGAPGSSRFDIAAISPQDNRPAFSNCGGNFGLQLKKAGFDALVLRGRCHKLSRLEISEKGAVLLDAAQLRGLDTDECLRRLADLCDGSYAAMCIGPAGENMESDASVIADGHSAGRAGLGAVLGFKQLKAITVTGTKKCPIYDENEALKICRSWNEQLKALANKDSEGKYCTACPLHCPRRHRGENKRADALGKDGAKGSHEDKKERRRAGYDRIMSAFRPTENAGEFCKNYSEAVCTLGQCMFTVNGLVPDGDNRHLPALLEAVTGEKFTICSLADIGKNCRLPETQLQNRFGK